MELPPDLENFAHAAIASSASALFVTDPDGLIQWVNEAFERLSGYSREEAIGKTPALLRSAVQPTKVFHDMWETVRAGQTWRGEIVNRRKNGETYVVAQTVTPLVDARGRLTNLVACHEDVTGRRNAETKAKHLAEHDLLTDLPNRASFDERMRAAVDDVRGGTSTVGLLFIDLDRFKLVNETLGHVVGDLLLRTVAERLRDCVRSTDVVSRLGGDEFAVLMPACDPLDARRVAERIVACLSEPLMIANHDVMITASVGIACSSADVGDAETLLRHADVAMTHVKDEGRNGYSFFSGGIIARPHSGLDIQVGLRRALTRGELSLRYQPQVSAADGSLLGVEALLRWRSPRLGDVSPADFIPVAEQTGVIVDIDRFVLHAACAQAKAWRDAGVDIPRVAVNVSGATFRRGKLVQWIEEELASTGLGAGCLEIELTEGIVMHDAAKVIESLASLRALGVRVALDDFGTGYSSLSYLKRFKLDTLKIDRSFVAGLPEDTDSRAIAGLIVAMAKALRMETVAEGVETQAQSAFLTGLGCSALQGYLFAPALGVEEIARFGRGAGARPKP